MFLSKRTHEPVVMIEQVGSSFNASDFILGDSSAPRLLLSIEGKFVSYA
jgi:hypothetical protein